MNKQVYAILILLICIVCERQAYAINTLAPNINAIGTNVVDEVVSGKSLLEPVLIPNEVLGANVSEAANNLPVELTDTVEKIDLNFAKKLSQLTPLTALSEKITILDKQQQPLFNDVSVENGLRAIEHQWLLMLNAEELEVIKRLAKQNVVTLVSKQEFTELSMMLVKFRVAKPFDDIEKVGALLPKSMHDKLSRDYVYQAQISSKAANEQTQKAPPKVTERLLGICTPRINVGVIDSAVDTKHAVFEQAKLTRRSFVNENIIPPKAHGTAVSALLVGNSKNFQGVIPKAPLYVAEVFYGQNNFNQGASLFNLVAGVNWLLTQNVGVINMSLSGPNNTILAKTIEQTIANNVVVVAAVGNNGPHAAPQYPAAYHGVVGVTAVDQQNKLYRWANRGNYIDFSALGVSVKTAKAGGKYTIESGTSMAAPIVTAMVACAKQQKINYWEYLLKHAQDLGEQGYDPLFGHGRIN